MVSNTCFVPGCKTGYSSDRQKCKREGVKSKSLFKAPQDDALFEIWKKVIPRKDKELTKNCRVCELHFLPEDIQNYFITKLPDGTVDKIERGKKSLRAGAIPYIFPMLPGYLSKCIPKRKLPVEAGKRKRSEMKVIAVSAKEDADVNEEGIPPINSSTLLNSFQDSTNTESSTTFSELNETDMDAKKSTSNNSSFVLESFEDNKNIESSTTFNDFNFKCLLENLNMIKKPSEWWIITSFVEFVICAKWTKEYVTERRVVIEQDLNVKVFLKDSRVDVSSGKKIECLDDVSFLLNEIDNLLLCPGTQQESEKKCLSYFGGKYTRTRIQRGKLPTLCAECHKINILKDKADKRKERERIRIPKLYQTIICEKRKIVRLRRKVALLQQKIAFLKKNRSSDEEMTGTLSNLSVSQQMSAQPRSSKVHSDEVLLFELPVDPEVSLVSECNENSSES